MLAQPQKAEDISVQLDDQHPLQRLCSPSRGQSSVFHAAGLTSFAYSFYWLVANPNQINESYGWHMQYLTIIGLSLSAATFAAALLADLTGSRMLFGIKNGLSVASAPIEVLISLLYWGLSFIDPALVLPDWAEPMPLLVDFTFHLVPACALVADLLFFSPPWTITAMPTLSLSLGIAFSYWWWIERCFAFNNFYPYPIFCMLSTPERIGLFFFSAVLMTLSTFMLTGLYGLVNGRTGKQLIHDEPSKLHLVVAFTSSGFAEMGNFVGKL